MSQVSILYHGILTGTKVQQTLKCCNLLKKCPILHRKIVNWTVLRAAHDDVDDISRKFEFSTNLLYPQQQVLTVEK